MIRFIFKVISIMNKDKISKKNSIVSPHNLNKFIIITNVFHFDKDGENFGFFCFPHTNFVKIWISQNWKNNPWWPHVNPHALQNVKMHIYIYIYIWFWHIPPSYFLQKITLPHVKALNLNYILAKSNKDNVNISFLPAQLSLIS